MKQKVKQLGSSLLGLVLASEAFASGGVAKTVKWYEVILPSLHIDHKWEPTLGSLACTVLIFIAGLKYKAKVAASG